MNVVEQIIDTTESSMDAIQNNAIANTGENNNIDMIVNKNDCTVIDNGISNDQNIGEMDLIEEQHDNTSVNNTQSHYNLRERRSFWKNKANDENDNSMSKGFVGVHRHVSLIDEVKEYGKAGVKAVIDELKQMIELQVFEPVHKLDVKNSKFITSRMFIKKKNDGIVKARLVAGGHRQEKLVYDIMDELNSPTVMGESTMIQLSIAAAERRKIATLDIKGAYLNADMERDVYMELNSYESSILIDIESSYKKYLNNNGKLYVKLNKALYGCIESGKLFFKHLKNSLLQYGFRQCKYDDCI
jgi:negative regulator of genetic competence, sporulation and motility